MSEEIDTIPEEDEEAIEFEKIVEHRLVELLYAKESD